MLFNRTKMKVKRANITQTFLYVKKLSLSFLILFNFDFRYLYLFYPMFILFRESNQEKCIAFLLELGFHKYKRMVYLDRTVIFFIEITSGLQGGILLKTISFIGITKFIHLLISIISSIEVCYAIHINN